MHNNPFLKRSDVYEQCVYWPTQVLRARIRISSRAPLLELKSGDLRVERFERVWRVLNSLIREKYQFLGLKGVYIVVRYTLKFELNYEVSFKGLLSRLF